MRITLAHSHPNTFGGGERALLEVSRGLRDAGHSVRLLVGDYQPSQTYPELDDFPRQRLSQRQWLTHVEDADAIVANSFGANLLALRNGRRVAYWVHSLRSLFLQPGASGPGATVRRALDQRAVHGAARLVANSRYTAGRLPALYRREADEVAYPGVDLGLYRPGEGDGSYAITVGRLAPEKGLERLFQAWESLPDVPLVIVGAGDPAYVASLWKLAPGNVRFRGALPPRAVAAAYAGARLAVFTPTDEEFGIAPLEAMACGLPVVATASGGLPEVVVDGETGWLVPDDAEHLPELAYAVQRVWSNPSERRRLGDNGPLRAGQFTWQRTVRTIEAVCLGLAGRQPGADQ